MKIPATFNNILIIRTDRIGDVVLTTPAIKALRQAYPTARISILIAAGSFDLINGNPYVDEILMDDRKGQHKGLFGFLKLAREIRSKKFDLAVIFHTKRRYNLACSLAGIPCRLGYKNNKFGFLLTLPLKDIRLLGEKHESEYCMDVLKAIGVQNFDLDIFVPMQKEAEEWARQWMQENDIISNAFVVIHPGASDPTKCWPAANFALLMDRLAEHFKLRIVLIGSIQTMPLANEILNKTQRSSEMINLTGKTTLAQMTSLLRRSCLLVSNDSGPVHVAAGVGINVISLFLRNQPGINPQRWQPLGTRSFILSNKQGEEIRLNKQGNPVSGQAGSISVENVMELIEQIFKRDSQYEIF